MRAVCFVLMGLPITAALVLVSLYRLCLVLYSNKCFSKLSSNKCFSNLVLQGKTPLAILPFLFGATLVALDKGGRGGVVKTIAVGYILRRLVAMSCCLGQLHKLDFRNAFNCVHREKTLEAVEGLVPTVHRSSEVLTQTANNFATRAGTGLKLEPFKSSH